MSKALWTTVLFYLLSLGSALAAETNGTIHYHVKAGDTAVTVSSYLFEDFNYWKRIIQANPQNANPDASLRAGSDLVLIPTHPLPDALTKDCARDFQKFCFFMPENKTVNRCLEENYDRLSKSCRAILFPCNESVQKYCSEQLRLHNVAKTQDCLLSRPNDVPKACIDSIRAERAAKK
jgi:hypothetical protein